MVSLAEEHGNFSAFHRFHGIDFIHVQAIAVLEDEASEVENGEVRELPVVEGSGHLCTDAGVSAVLDGERKPFHVGCRLHDGGSSHGLAL